MVRTPAAFRGVRRIVEGELWELGPFDLHDAPETWFEEDGMGSFQIEAIRAELDCRYSEKRVEFSFERENEGEAVLGRGCAEIATPGRLEGRLYFHFGGDSSFVAERVRRPRLGRSARAGRG